MGNNIIRLAFYGGIVGLAWGAIHTIGLWSLGPEGVARAAGSLIGGSVIGALVAASLPRLRDLLVRSR